MHFAKHHRHMIVIPTLFLVLVTALTACGASLSSAARTTAAPTLPPTSTFQSTATLQPTATPLATAASTLGWVVYHDPRYPFQVPVPPRWQVAPSTDSTPGTSCTWYEVNVFAPDQKPLLSGPIAEVNQEVIYFSFEHDCPPVDPASWAPASGGITINGISTTLYGRVSLDGYIQRLAVITLGGSWCHFYMQSPADTAKRDLSVFLGMLSGFKYAGQ